MSDKTKFKTSVGGQAVMEGIMMRGPEKICLAVRTPDGAIVTETDETKAHGWTKIPFVRGIFVFIDSFITGYKTLMRSAELSMTEEEKEEETSKFENWVDKHFGEKAMKALMFLSAIIGIVLALFLFMWLPTTIVKLLGDGVASSNMLKSLIEGVIKIVLFIAYLALMRRLSDMRRTFGYHGAEHKTIFCYENGLPLTVENIRKQTRFHPRCGTSFLLIVLVIAILVNSLLPWEATGMRVLYKLLLLPVIMGISYEIIRFAGKHDNPVTRAISAPGLWLQRLTTCEPDDSMIEVAIDAVTPVLPATPDGAIW